MANPLLPKPSLSATGSYFLSLGFRAFGGLDDVLALLTRELVERRTWLREADLTEALTYTKLLPGSTVVQVVAYLGWKLRGWLSALLATTAFLLPAFALIMALTVGYQQLVHLAGVPAALRDLTAAVAGVLLVTAWTLGKKPLATTTCLVLAGVALAASLAWNVNPALLVVAALGYATGTTPRLEFLPTQAGDVEPTHADICKARDLLGYAPRTPLAAGLYHFLRWLKADGAAPHA